MEGVGQGAVALESTGALKKAQKRMQCWDTYARGDMWIIKGDIQEFPKLSPVPRFAATAVKVTFFLATRMQH